MRDPLGLFMGSIASPETRRQYQSKLNLFLTGIGMEGSLEVKARAFVRKAKSNKKWAFNVAAGFVAYHKMRYDNKEITAGTIRNYYKPIKVFCDTNDITINWKGITRGLPKSRKFAQDRAPTTEEIRKLVEYPDRRMKGIVFLMSASGIRVGAWDYLRWGHIEPVYNDKKEVIAAKLQVYAGEPEQYPAFITPEAYQYLKEWMQFREQYGEKVGPKSWVMRDTFKSAVLQPTHHHGLASAPKQLKSSGIRAMLKRAWISQGILVASEEELEFKSSHGFRKRFKTQCELAGMKPLNIECLLGHDTGIAGSAYYRPTEREMLEECLKAAPFLQISEVLQMKREIEQQEKRHQVDMGKVQQQVDRLQSQLATLVSEGLFARSAVGESNHSSQSHK
jgi:integrase